MDTRDTCLPGFQGFPIQFTNWASLDKASITEANDIKLQFSPSEVPATYVKESGLLNLNGGMNTFFMGGTIYTVQAARFSKPKQEGISDFSNNTIRAEFQLWGTASPNAGNVPDLAVLVIPLKMDPVDTSAGTAILHLVSGKAVPLLATIPQGKGTDLIRYSTCVETNNTEKGSKKTIRIAVAYWTSGAKYTQEQGVLVDARLGKGVTLAPNGVPNILGYSLLSSFNTEVLESGEKRKVDRQYHTKKDVLQPYTPTLPMDLTSIQKKDGVFLIKDFQLKKEISNSTSNYKCVAIKPSRDIVNGQLQIDPSTGKRLDQELADSEEQTNETLPENSSSSAATASFMSILIGIGIFLGVTILAGLLVMIGTWTFTRKSNNVPPVAKQIKEMIQAMPNKVTGN